MVTARHILSSWRRTTAFLVCLTVIVVESQHQHGVPQQQQQQQYMGQQPVMGVPQQVPQGYGQNVVNQQQQQQVQYAQYQQAPPTGANQNLIRDKAHIQDREHIKEHLQGVVDHPDVAKMSDEELQFHYFKMHDNDDNNKLDGCELIKSLIHWHVEESKHLANTQGQGQGQGHGHSHGHQQQPPPPPPQGGIPQQPGNATPGIGTTKIFTEQELSMMIDPILDMDDRNKDGFIDYPEFVAAQQSRGF